MKYCANCGAPMEESAAFCSACGTSAAAAPVQRAAQPVQQAYQQPVQQVYQQPVQPMYQPVGYVVPLRQTPAEPSTKNGLGIAGFVLSLVGAVIAWIPVVGLFSLFPLVPGFILSVIGFILGLVKKRRFGLALAGIILSVCGFFILAMVSSLLMQERIYY